MTQGDVGLATHQVSQATRDLSIGDPRGVAWESDGLQGYVTGMGSNNLIVVDGDPMHDLKLLASNGRDLRVIMRDGHFVKRELHVRGYVRCVDDLLLFGPRTSELRVGRTAVARCWRRSATCG